MNPTPSTPFRQTLPAMRLMLVVAGVLVFSVGITLNLLTTQTDRFFAWTIATPMTAAFLGAWVYVFFLIGFCAMAFASWSAARRIQN